MTSISGIVLLFFKFIQVLFTRGKFADLETS